LKTPNAEAPGDFRAKSQKGAVNADDRIPENGAADRTEPTPRENTALHERAGGGVREIHTHEFNLLVEGDLMETQFRSGHWTGAG
jgi:hypothetical protein